MHGQIPELSKDFRAFESAAEAGAVQTLREVREQLRLSAPFDTLRFNA